MKRILLLLLCVCSLTMYAQITINGTVTDKAGQPLGGALVHETGTFNATTTDDDGNFTLTVRGITSEITVRLVGYSPQTREVGLQTNFRFDLEEANILSAVSVVGSRSLNRSKTNSAVPIDIIDIREITTSQGQLDVNQMLQFAAPSFNANRQTGSDGSDHVDPATLRGLGPDQTLVLINGKRRHQSALVNIYGTRGRGNTGTDLNAIPAAAIERIEILRDGAAAQYGSDAIAGVINIVLKENVGFTGNVNVGAHSAKDNPNRQYFDGENVQLNANYGFRVGERGFVNVTGDYWFRGHTNRYDPSLYRRQFGDAQGANFNTTVNMQLPLGDRVVFYAFGGENFRQTQAYAWSRDADSERNVKAIYPNGFDPKILSDINDRSAVAGFKGNVGKWGADFSHGFGLNRFHYFGANTLNASLVERSPTRFDDGGFQLKMRTTNLDFTRYFRDWLQGTNLAFGVEHRIENYQIFAGEEASWKNYGPVYLVTPDGDSVVRPGGAQGFPGFAPQNEVNASRSNLGLYGDADLNLTKDLAVGTALRFERYSDFGNTLNGKLTGRYRITDGWAIRASASTGFRAPSLAQIYFNQVYTDFESGVAIDKFLAGNNSNVTRALGIPALKQETSVNMGGGLTYASNNFTFSVDAYRIAIQDRIVLTADFDASDDKIGADLQALKVGSARFFANSINTTTNGVDIVGSYTYPLSDGARLNAILAANVNRMRIDKVNVPSRLAGKEDFFLSRREEMFILASAPPLKGNLTLQYTTPRYGVTLRGTYFDKVELIDYVDAMDVYDPRFVTDLSFNFRLTDIIGWTVGATNLFNVYPTKQDAETEGGGLYDPVQMGFNGRFLFSRLNFRF